jgi:hypothetical protein
MAVTYGDWLPELVARCNRKTVRPAGFERRSAKRPFLGLTRMSLTGQTRPFCVSIELAHSWHWANGFLYEGFSGSHD